MRTRAERRITARYRWDRLKVSFWFAPALMALAAVLLSWAMFWIDTGIPNSKSKYETFSRSEARLLPGIVGMSMAARPG